MDAGDTAAVADCLRKVKERCRLEPQAKVHSCYEAGRDGWWLHRWLIEQGVDNPSFPGGHRWHAPAYLSGSNTLERAV